MRTQAGSDRLEILQHTPRLRKKALVLGLCWIALAGCTATALAPKYVVSIHGTAPDLAVAMEDLFHIIAVGSATILILVCFPGSVAVLVECWLHWKKQEAPDVAYENELTL
jgi:hypothetical protein